MSKTFYFKLSLLYNKKWEVYTHARTSAWKMHAIKHDVAPQAASSQLNPSWETLSAVLHPNNKPPRALVLTFLSILHPGQATKTWYPNCNSCRNSVSCNKRFGFGCHCCFFPFWRHYLNSTAALTDMSVCITVTYHDKPMFSQNKIVAVATCVFIDATDLFASGWKSQETKWWK